MTTTTTTTRVDELKGRLQAALTEARDISAKADGEGRDFTDEERALVQQKMAEAKDLGDQLKKAKGDAGLRSAIANFGDDFGLDEPGEKRAPEGFHLPERGKSLGQWFTESTEYKEMLSAAPGGQFSKQHRVQSRPAGVKHLVRPARGQKALVTGASDTSAGAFVQNDYLGLQVALDAFQRPLMLRDLVTPGNTDSDTVEYVRITSTTNNAAPVAEATTTANGTKPESGMATAKITTAVKTIAHWIPATKRSLSDAAQMRTLIDSFLEYGLEEELEDQMVSGDGTGENFEGIATVSGVQAQAWDTNLLTTLRKAKTKVRTVGRSIPTGYVLNPADVEALDLLTDNENRYYFGGPSGTIMIGTNAPLWNLPVIESEATPAGKGWVGDWRKAILWDREQATITMSDSHANFFIQNLVAILAEMRAAFGVIQPNAFVEIDLTAA